MITDLSQARDEMQEAFRAAWVGADWTTIRGAATWAKPPHVEWDGLDDGHVQDSTAPFARVLIRHKAKPQVAFRGPFQQKQRYTATGIITVQVFAPNSGRNGLALAEKLAIIAQSAFLGRVTPNGVWFSNMVPKEIGADGDGFYQWNVTGTFSYDTLE